MSAFGDLKYASDFTHFGYVNPDAPKGGRFSEAASGGLFNQSGQTFDSFNSYILKGRGAGGMELTFASLMKPAGDEPDSMYGFAAERVHISADGLTYRFDLRPQARFHDGTRLTAHDVAFSLTVLKESGHPIIQRGLQDIRSVTAADEASVEIRFAETRGRDSPLFAARLPIFSKADYAQRPFDSSTMDIPAGSGPYRVATFEPGRYIEFHRVAKWWGENLPVCRGQFNFDILRLEYYRDSEAAFEGFTAKNYTFREENIARLWKTRYDFPAIRDGRVKREILPDDTLAAAQGWFINTRRPKFKNRHLREALIYAFDFEWTNENIMFGAYLRTHSLFQNSDMMANGKPVGGELEILEQYRDKLPAEIFGDPFVPPVSDGSGQDRRLLRKASQLLRDGGFAIRDGICLDGTTGEQVTVEFLLEDPAMEKHHVTLIRNLGVLGIAAELRTIDSVQYRGRLNNFDFDLAMATLPFTTTPGEILRSLFSSESARTPGSGNLAGVTDEIIDSLIDRICAAATRSEVVASARALDRLFRAGRYWIPNWYLPSRWIAYWDEFERPAVRPRYTRGIPDTWWRRAVAKH